jgi:hypothetical protein
MMISSSRSQDVSSQAVQLVLRQLQSRDSTVRAHEAAHIAAGAGVVTSGAQYSYQRGPDGREYAIGGEVGIDLSPVSGNPQATIAKMETVRRAALAPAQPSAPDLSIAAAATQMEEKARADAFNKAQKSENQPGSVVDLSA